jgi:site-specific recombinase XerD
MKQKKSIEELADGLLFQLQGMSYRKNTLYNYRNILNSISTFMCKSAINEYSAEVGQRFLYNYFSTHKIDSNFQKSIKTVIRRLNDFYECTSYSIQKKQSSARLPGGYGILLDDYLNYCKNAGNKSATIEGKRKFCGDFLLFLFELDCIEIDSINTKYIGKACIRFQNKDAWSAVRQFMVYLYEKKIIDYDYSTIIPHYTRRFVIPSTYTEDEIRCFENAIDRSTKIGIRDYAMLLLATRLGMRSGDIVKLSFSEVDFEQGKIDIIQDKTNQPLELPLLPEIRDALLNYIKIARPEVKYEKRIFIRQNAPYQGITTSVLRFITTNYFLKAGINISGEKHGVHTFRSSLASSMVNDNIPYEVVRKVLGHTDPDAMKHYAKLDIERLREYGIDTLEPSGKFKNFLNGGLTDVEI